MATVSNPREVTREIRRVRQARLYKPDPVPADVLDELLEIARWTGSSRNTQPWEFIVVTDRDLLRQISQIRTPINWVADAPLAIAIVLAGESPLSEAFDEGRVTERVLIGARLLGLGGGTAWFGDDKQQAQAKRSWVSRPSEPRAPSWCSATRRRPKITARIRRPRDAGRSRSWSATIGWDKAPVLARSTRPSLPPCTTARHDAPCHSLGRSPRNAVARGAARPTSRWGSPRSLSSIKGRGFRRTSCLISSVRISCHPEKPGLGFRPVLTGNHETLQARAKCRSL